MDPMTADADHITADGFILAMGGDPNVVQWEELK